MAPLKNQLRPVEPDFAETAPVRLAFSTAVAASPEAVFHTLAEDTEGWPEWFGPVKQSVPLEAGRRQLLLAGGIRVEETVLITEAPKRYTYRADSVNRSGVKALLEEWRIEPAGSGSTVQWLLAIDTGKPLGVVLRLLSPVVRMTFRSSMRKLERRSG